MSTLSKCLSVTLVAFATAVVVPSYYDTHISHGNIVTAPHQYGQPPQSNHYQTHSFAGSSQWLGNLQSAPYAATGYHPLTFGVPRHDGGPRLYDTSGFHSASLRNNFGHGPPSTFVDHTEPGSVFLNAVPHFTVTSAGQNPTPVLSTKARMSYSDYLVKPLHCSKVSTHCCGTKTYIEATCGGADHVLITFMSAKDYNYTLNNAEFTDLSGRYFLGSVKVCNLGPRGDVFVSVW